MAKASIHIADICRYCDHADSHFRGNIECTLHKVRSIPEFSVCDDYLPVTKPLRVKGKKQTEERIAQRIKGR